MKFVQCVAVLLVKFLVVSSVQRKILWEYLEGKDCDAPSGGGQTEAAPCGSAGKDPKEVLFEPQTPLDSWFRGWRSCKVLCRKV